MSREELLKEARQANLVDYLRSKGVDLKRKGVGSYCLAEHDSLVITGFKWNWFSRNMSGNALDYLIKVEGMEFKDAVAALTGKTLQSTGNSSARRHKQILAYLCKSRGLDYTRIKQLIQRGYLDTDERNNCCFNIYEYGSRLNGGKGDYIGAELHGSNPKKPFKGFTGGFKHGVGFHLNWKCKSASVDRLYAFESAIDLLSFLTLVEAGEIKADIENSVLLSLGGVKLEVLYTCLNAYEVQEQVFLCVDNDEAGETFLDEFKGIEGFTELRPDKIYKDWNDRLLGNCG
jgi:hypothetical protein